ncbi:MAG TPA: polysaccharide deacetylase family protein [Methylomirabilota bacterium]|nr:polysaccharide deacetylase family protein [Methylomirabilota bacterium]
MTAGRGLRRAAAAGLAAVLLSGCVTGAPGGQGRSASESADFIVITAREGDTTTELARRFLGDSALAWRIEDYNDLTTLTPGQTVIIPRKPWNLSGVHANGYQLVPVLTYHDIGPQTRGRLVIGTKSFADQMRYLKDNHYRVITLAELFEFLQLKRQLPRRAVVLTFDDGYRSFLTHAYPVLKELGFTATLFVYTDYVGTGRNALDWSDLSRLAAEGFQVEGHTRSHGDLRRQPGESEADHGRRLRAELDSSQRLFQQRLGRPARFLAYPYGAADDAVLAYTRDAGFQGGLTVFREGNASFVPMYRIRRSQIYAEMTLDDFVKNLNTSATEPIR